MPLSNNQKIRFILTPVVAKYKGRLLLALISLLVASASTLAVPKWVGVIGNALSAEQFALMQQSFKELIVIVVIMGFSTAYRFYNMSWLGERVVTDIRQQLFAHLLVLPKSFYDKSQSGELISRITTDTTLVERVVGTSISMLLRNILMLVGSLAMLLYTSVQLTILVLLVIPIALFPVIKIMRVARRLSKESQTYIANASSFAAQVLSVMDVTKAYQYEQTALDAFKAIGEEGFLVSKRRITARAWLSAFLIVLMLCAMVSVLWVGMIAVLKQEMSSGDLSQFFMYAVFLASAVGSLSEVSGDVVRAFGAMDRIAELLSEAQQIDEGSLSTVSYDICFKDVKFSYPGRTHTEILHGLSFDIKEGSLTAIVGQSGAGKSTLFKLLMRYYPVTFGKVSIGGIPIQSLKLNDLRGLIAYVGHDAGIFPTSIRDNLCMGKIYSEVDIIKACEKANIADFISTLGEGYDTELGERGILLSEGQRQRLALARAILRNAPIVLLDEATNALDAITEEAINRALLETFRDKTVIVIAHRLSTVVHADKIIVLDQGEVESIGTHSLLTKQSAIYAQLAKIQLLS